MLTKEEREYRLALGQSLKKYREMMGFSLTDVENLTMIKKQQISMWEQGKRRINEEQLELLSKIYHSQKSIIEQTAYDYIEVTKSADLNKYLTCQFELDGTHIKVQDKLTSRSKIYKIPAYLLAEMKKDFQK
ncbi:helix-turn-helix transcriptional regulator [Staphylococcus pseudintermedius]|nr:helix-turn-helix transcriptional regulator [Staphylococcus pseudintermedius]